MADMSLSDLSAEMRAIDFCMLSTKTETGALASRPMSNNRDVDYDGDSWFFACDDARFIGEIARDPHVGLGFSGATSLLGKPGIFIHIAGRAQVIRDKAALAAHWVEDLERWFAQGIDTPGMVMLKVSAERVHYWDGEESGEVTLR